MLPSAVRILWLFHMCGNACTYVVYQELISTVYMNDDCIGVWVFSHVWYSNMAV